MPENLQKFSDKCRICLTASQQMLFLSDPLKENDWVTIVSALEYVMGVKDTPLKSICAICKGLLCIAYDLKKQFFRSTQILNGESMIEVVDNCSSGAPVELIIGGSKYDLNDIVIVENEEGNKHSFDGFLKNLGKTVSAKIVQKDYRFRPVEEESEVVLLEKTDKVIIEEIEVQHETDVDQFIIEINQDINPDSFIAVVGEKTVEETFQCRFCSKNCISKGRYLAHMKVCSNLQAGRKQFLCPFCETMFLSQDELQKHVESDHSENDKALICEKCGHIAHTIQSLQYHILKHSKRKYECDQCSKSFYSKSNLDSHKRIHNQTAQALCTLCGKSFTTKSGLFYHMKKHKNDRDYVCNYCDKRYYILNSLKRHIRTHTSERPFLCQDCDKKFFSKAELCKHQMIHTGERPFKCQYCEKGFTQKFNLDVHLMSHSGTFICEICDKSFVDTKCLTKHLKDKHGVT